MNLKKIVNEYDGIENTYEYAYVGIPKGVGGLERSFFGTWHDFKKKHPHFSPTSKIPVVLYIHGSSGLFRGEVYREYITNEAESIFFAVMAQN